MSKYIITAEGIPEDARVELEDELNNGRKKFIVVSRHVNVEKLG